MQLAAEDILKYIRIETPRRGRFTSAQYLQVDSVSLFGKKQGHIRGHSVIICR